MATIDRSPALDRSPLRPASRRRLLLGLAIATLGPLLVAPVSIGLMDRLPAIPYYLAIALATWFGRAAAGAMATAVSALLLLVFSFPPADTIGIRDDDVASLVGFVVLCSMLVLAFAFERAAAARVRITHQRLELLADVTRILKTDLDSAGALQRLAARVVPELADWCAIHVLDGDEPVAVAVAHPDPARVALARRLQEDYPARRDDPGGVAEVLRTGEHLFVPDVTPEMVRAGARDETHLALVEDLGLRSAIVAPLSARGRTFGAITLIVAEGEWRYGQEDVDFVLDLAARTATIVDTIRAYESEHAAVERNRLLQDFAHALAGATTLHDVLEVVVRDALRMLGATRGLVALTDEDRRELRVARNVGYPADVEERWGTFPLSGRLPLSEAVRERRTVAVHGREERDLRYPALAAEDMPEDTLVCVPLVAEDEAVGGICLGYPRIGPLSDTELRFLSAIASQAGQALRRALLFEDRDRTARLLQAALLPRELPAIGGVDLAAGYWPAGRSAEVGGDFYDVIALDDGFIALVGDVCGRGPEAAAVMGLARTTARVLARRERSLGAMFAQVNEALLNEVGEDVGTFVTMCGVRATGRTDGNGYDLEIVCAGHPHPVLVGRGAPRAVGTSGLVLGVERAPTIASSHERIRPGESLVLYTDGLAERARGHVPLAEDPDLTGALERLPREGPTDLIDAVSCVLASDGGVDDAAVLVVRVREP